MVWMKGYLSSSDRAVGVRQTKWLVVSASHRSRSHVCFDAQNRWRNFHGIHTAAYQVPGTLHTVKSFGGKLASSMQMCACMPREMCCTITVILSFRDAHVHAYTLFLCSCPNSSSAQKNSRTRQHRDKHTHTPTAIILHHQSEGKPSCYLG